MNKIKTANGLTLVVLLLFSLVLAACGDATSTTGPAATTAAGTSAVAATTTAAGATASAATTTAAGATTTAAGATTAAASGKKVVVASKDFPESLIVAEMYAAALENAGIPVERKMNLGTEQIVQAAIVKGDVSLYPEYTGTGAGAILKLQNPPNDPKKLYDLVNSEYQKQFNLTWLDVAPHSNRNGIAVTKAAADKYKLKNLSDLAPVAKELTFASNPQFIGDRSAVDGLKSLQKTYGGFEFKEVKQVDIKLRYKALVDGQADACVAFGTDGELAGYGLVWLEDDKNNFGPYQTGPVVRNDILAAYPKIKDILNPVTAKLTTEKISALNWSVSGPDKKEPVDVAKAFLKAEGLVK